MTNLSETRLNNASLADLRAEIDRVDNALCRLLNERMDLSRRVGLAKRGPMQTETLPILHPQRERDVMETAIACVPLAPPSAPAMIYREIMTVGITAYQSPLALAVAVANPEKSVQLDRLIRNHFGITATQALLEDPKAALSSVCEGQHIAAILPWVDESVWWQELATSPLAIIARLPAVIWPTSVASPLEGDVETGEASPLPPYQGDEPFALVSHANPDILCHPDLAAHLILSENDAELPGGMYKEIHQGFESHHGSAEAQPKAKRLFLGNGPAPKGSTPIEHLADRGWRSVGAWPQPLDLRVKSSHDHSQN